MKSCFAPVAMLLALTWSASAAASDCEPVELPVTAAEVGGSGSFVRLRLVDPVNEGAVDADSTVVVEVDYRVANFAPGEYGLMMYFPSLVSAMSPHGPEGRYTLPKASGRVRLCVTLREVYAASQVRWPLTMYVDLNKRKENVSPKFAAMFEPVVVSSPVSLNAVRQPGASENAQASAVDPAYRDAVTRLMGMVMEVKAVGAICPGEAELNAEFTAAHRGWTARNAKLIDHVHALQRDLYLRDMKRADLVEEVMNFHMTHVLNSLDEMPPEQLRNYCRRQLRELSNPRSDLETAGAAQFLIVRTQGPAGMPAPK